MRHFFELLSTMKLLPVDLYATVVVSVLASANAVEAVEMVKATGVLDDPTLRVFLLLGALIGGLGAALTWPGKDTKDALIKWIVAFSLSLSLAPGVIRIAEFEPSADVVFSVAAVVSLSSWIIVRFLRSLTVEDIRSAFVAFLSRVFNMQPPANKTEEKKR